jgi:hypothetical protein
VSKLRDGCSYCEKGKNIVLIIRIITSCLIKTSGTKRYVGVITTELGIDSCLEDFFLILIWSRLL